MLYMDRATEAIAHFVGLFATIVEQEWERTTYQEFIATVRPDADLSPLPNTATAFSADYQLKDYVPGLDYQPQPPVWVQYTAWSDVVFSAPEIPISPAMIFAYPGYLPHDFFRYGAGQQILLPEVHLPGSVATYVNQGIRLSDDDYFAVGDHHLHFSPPAVDDSQPLQLFGAALELTPISAEDIPGDAGELKAFVKGTSEDISTFNPTPGEGQSLFVHQAHRIEGSYVNGQKVDEAPTLSDHFDFAARLDAIASADDPLPENVTLKDGRWEVDVSVDADTGSNILINNAVLKNLWVGASVTAVIGDHYQTNAIIQINSWCDSDAITKIVSGWDQDPVATHAFNIANFERVDPSADQSAPDPDWGFPAHWVVKEVEGDLMIVNWLQQFTFMSDNDIGILSSSGATTAVTSGSNIAYNDVSLFDLASSYDLILIGGGWYDLNVIQQMNILCDNDVVGAVAGFETTGKGSISTSGNLLWNHANIYTIGSSDPAGELPDWYRTMADSLASGEGSINDGVLSDPAFQGLSALRVLYISGDLINVQYASMTNILGDSDQIALAMDSIGLHPEAEWTLTMGNNALVNEAAIVDLDSLGKTYVGGEQYSSNLLVQADIISTEPEFQSRDPDVLASEAVVFLDDLAPDDTNDDHSNEGNLDPDNAHGDALQTLIG